MGLSFSFFLFFFPFNVGFYIISNSWKHYVFVLTSVAFRSYRVLYAGVPAVAWHTSLISNFFTWPEIWVLFEVKCETLIFGPYTNPWVFLGPTRCLSNIVLKDLRLSEIFRMCYRCSSLPTHLPTLTEMIVSVYVKSIAFSQGEKSAYVCVYIYKNIYTDINTYIHIYTHIKNIYICMYVSGALCVHIYYIYISVYIMCVYIIYI